MERKPDDRPRRGHWRGRAAFALLLLLTCVAAAGKGDVHSPQRRLAEDRAVLDRARAGLAASLDFFRSHPEGFNSEAAGRGRFPARAARMSAWVAWSSVLDYLRLLEQLRDRWMPRFDARDLTRDSDAFALGYGAFLAGYRYALEFIGEVERNPWMDGILDQDVPEIGLPAGTYTRFKMHYLNSLRATEFAALEVVAGIRKRKGWSPPGTVLSDRDFIWRMGKGRGLVLTAQNAVDVLRGGLHSAWLPVQTGVSRFMGDTRVRREGTALISAAQVRSLIPRLLPGDILLERREWYLSNLGLPGFWTHAALYVGTPEERRAFFSGPELQSWLERRGGAGGDFEDLLQRRYPEAYVHSLEAQAEGVPRVLEAIGEGVTFTALEHTAAADSLAVLRPRLSRQEKAAALYQAFHYSGRPYDFDFDFRTDSALVCSELVYKAYEPGGSRQGLPLETETILGRPVVTPNGLARLYDRNADAAAPLFDLVLFLDGYERGERAEESTPAAFRASWRRPKWHVLVQEPPEPALPGSAGESRL